MSESAASTGKPEPKLAKAKDHPGQVKETLISLIIAFIMAFVFRAFVAEAFIIPTGSMAPTLLGQHTRHQSPPTGANWEVNPPQHASGPSYRVDIEDPMTRQDSSVQAQRRAGDRILVFKYLYSIYDPKRWDVVVFKAPHDPQTNYIKRLIALPGEEPGLIDGDVFVRRPPKGESLPASVNSWALEGWQIQRKPERVQRTVWQDVFWSQFEPVTPAPGYSSPWVGAQSGGWNIQGRQSYEYTGAGPTTLSWNNGVRPITDYYAYNQTMGRPEFPVSDVNMCAGVEAAGASLEVSAVVRARGHEFRADISGTAVTLRMGELGPANQLGRQEVSEWKALGTGQLKRALAKGHVANLEFWHVDQSLQLWADGVLVARGEYDWVPGDRIRYTTRNTLQQIFEQALRNSGGNPIAANTAYEQPRIEWEFSGPVTLHRVGLQRDIYYQPGHRAEPGAPPARGTHPSARLVLGPDHFFVCGDNSPLSLDARLWGPPEPWVAEQIDGSDGIVPRDLLIGRAFFVYFPSLTKGGFGIPVPDFGRMRWIW
jgi:signal peptidase I